MLSVADSRFQGELMREAKGHGKLPKNYEIPAAFRDNTPERIERALKPAKETGLLPDFPFGSDFTEVEQRLIPALQTLKQKSTEPAQLISLALRGLFAKQNKESDEAIERMGLINAASLKDRLYRVLLRGALSR
jgi:hypothetical protein